MSFFLWCAVIGCALLLVSLLLDGLLDALDGLLPDGALVVAAAALGSFGVVGLALRSLVGETTSPALLAGAAALAALTVGAAARRLWVWMRRSMPRNAVEPTPGELVGEQVRVLWWRNGRGEVVGSTRGHQLTLPARSEEELSVGATAVVLDATDDGLVLTTLRITP